MKHLRIVQLMSDKEGNSMNYKVVEKFVSINGEGNLAGYLAVFIRFAGCNLSCSYCDTSWANKEGVKFELMSEQDIYDYIKSTGVKNVTLTGGEPLIQEDIYLLIEKLSFNSSLNIEIETNGSVDIKKYINIQPKPPNITMDYKLSSSNMESKMIIENFNYLKKSDLVKFAVSSMEDLNEAKYIIEKYNLEEKCSVHISPIYGAISMSAIIDFMKEHLMSNVKFQPQLHKIIWHKDKRGV